MTSSLEHCSVALKDEWTRTPNMTQTDTYRRKIFPNSNSHHIIQQQRMANNKRKYPVMAILRYFPKWCRLCGYTSQKVALQLQKLSQVSASDFRTCDLIQFISRLWSIEALLQRGNTLSDNQEAFERDYSLNLPNGEWDQDVSLPLFFFFLLFKQ